MASIHTAAAHAEAARRGIDADEHRILAKAQKRLEAVNLRLRAIRPTATTEQEAGIEYQALVSERGTLQQVIERARRNLR
jgi:hypothetical protein